MRKEEILIENHTPFPIWFKTYIRNLKPENSQDAQKPQRNFTFMNSASKLGK